MLWLNFSKILPPLLMIDKRDFKFVYFHFKCHWWVMELKLTYHYMSYNNSSSLWQNFIIFVYKLIEVPVIKVWCLSILKIFPYDIPGYWVRVVFQYFSYIVAVSFICAGNRSVRRKCPTYLKSLTNFIT